MADRIPMTPRGHRQLKEKLKHLKSVERPKNIQAIEEARGHGDLSENADYDAAKNHQGQLNAMITDIESKLAMAHVIDPAAISSEKVVFGATVTVSDVDSGDRVTYTIVGADESDISRNLISIESPIARAMIGKQEGDEVRVQTPKGSRALAIVAIRFAALED